MNEDEIIIIIADILENLRHSAPTLSSFELCEKFKNIIDSTADELAISDKFWEIV